MWIRKTVFRFEHPRLLPTSPDTAHPLTFHSALTQLSHRGMPVMPDLMTEFGRNENVRSNMHRRRRRVTKPSEQPNAVHDCLQYWMIIRTR